MLLMSRRAASSANKKARMGREIFSIDSPVRLQATKRLTAIGGVILAGIAISNLLEIKKIRTGSFLPALVFAVLIVLGLNALGIAY